MSAYVIVNVNTKQPEEYERYKEMAQQTVAQYGGRYLVRGGQMTVLEGTWNPTRIVILEFPTYETANEWWHSVEYAAAKELRQRLSTTDLVIVDGYNPALCGAGDPSDQVSTGTITTVDRYGPRETAIVGELVTSDPN